MRLIVAGLMVAVSLLPSTLAAEIVQYKGMCNASAALALDADHFVVADDDRNTLVVYQRGQPNGKNVPLKNLGAKNSDLEGAARIGDLIYWIGSHDKNKKKRRRLFATKIVKDDDGLTVEALPWPPYKKLVQALLKEQKFAALKLSENTLDIEGLAATPDGQLLIGLRNPLTGKKKDKKRKRRAIVIPLTNPRNVVERGEKPVFGDSIAIKLGGRGIRSIERIGKRYLIIAGSHKRHTRKEDFELYSWAPGSDPVPLRFDAKKDFAELNPEAIFALPGKHEMMILSDDGKDCDGLAKEQQSFRSITEPLP